MGQRARDYLPIVFVFLVAAECNILFLHSPIYFKQSGLAGTEPCFFLYYWIFLRNFCIGFGLFVATGAANSIVCSRTSDCGTIGRTQGEHSGEQRTKRRKAAVFVCISLRNPAERTSGTVFRYTECKAAVERLAGTDAEERKVNIICRGFF